MALDRPLIKMDPDEVIGHLDAGDITEDQALDYSLQKQIGKDFFGMSRDDVVMSLDRGLISEEQAASYADRQESGRVWYYTKETFRAPVWGVRKGLEELGQSADEAVNWGLNKIGVQQQDIDKANRFNTWTPVDAAAKVGTTVTDKINKPQSGYGRLVEGLAQGATGMAAGAVAAAFVPEAAIPAWAAKAPKLWSFLSSTAKGAVGDAFAFDPKDPRMADALDELGILPDFLAYTKAKPGDSQAEGRWKNVLEGAVFGAAMEPVMKGVGALAKYTKNKFWTEAAGNAANAGKKIDEAVVGIPPKVAMVDPTTKGLGDEYVEHIKMGLFGNESSGTKDPYSVQSAVNRNGERAHGKYQIMPATWGDWSMQMTRAEGGIAEILPKTAANQEKVASWRIGSWLKQGYSPAEIASMWYSGRPNYQKLKGVTDVYGKLDVPAYVEKFNKGFAKSIEHGPHRTYSETMIKRVYGDEEGDRLVTVLDSIAKSHAERKGVDAQEWWRQNLGDIRIGGSAEDIADDLSEKMYQWAGPNARQFEKALAEGKVTTGIDGKPRFEIPDTGIKITGLFGNEPQGMLSKLFGRKKERPSTFSYEGKLGDAIEHDLLFENYPQMRDINLRVDVGPSETVSGVHQWQGMNQGADVHITAPSVGDAIETLVHEMQHNVQWREGFAMGGGPEMFKDPQMLKAVEQKSKIKLKNTPGTSVHSLEQRIREVRKELLSLQGPDGKIPEGMQDRFNELYKMKRQLEDGQNKAVQQYVNTIYKGGDAFAMYERLGGEIEARDAAERYVRSNMGQDMSDVPHLGTQGSMADEAILFQSANMEAPRGAVRFTQDGRTIVHLFNNADASTLIHEVGHILRRQLDPEDIAKIEKHFGVPSGAKKWEVDAEEAFAEAFERYVMEGKAPASHLMEAFEALKQTLLNLYRDVKSAKIPMQDDVKQLFDKLLTVEKERLKPIIQQDFDRLHGLMSDFQKIAKGEMQVTAKDLSEGGAFNLSKFSSPDEVFGLIQHGFDSDPELLKKVTRGTVRLKDSALGAAAREENWMDTHIGVPLKELQQLYTGVKFLDEKLLAHMNVLDGWSKAVKQMAETAETDEELANLFLHIKGLQQYQFMLKGAQTEVARGLGSLRNRRMGSIDFTRMNPNEVEAIMKDRSKWEKVRDDIRKLDEPGLQSYARKLGKNRFVEGLLEYRQASLLWGLGTHVTNVLGTASAVVLDAGNKIIANLGVGLKEALTKGETERVRQTMAYAMAHIKGIGDALYLNGKGLASFWDVKKSQLKGEADAATKLAQFLDAPENGNVWKTLASGHSFTDPELVQTKWMDGSTGAMPKWMGGPILRLPFQALTAEDEFFKSIAYRAELTFQAYEAGMKVGHKGDALEKYVREIMDAPDMDIHRTALERAKDVTFSKNLEGMPKKFNELMNATSTGMVLKALFMPFTKIVFNILNFSAMRTPFGVLSKQMQRDLAAGGIRRAEAVTKMATGTALLGLGAYLYSDGRITGSAPEKQKDAWNNAGILPNAVRIGDTWVEYNRLQPISTFLRIGADLGKLWESKDLPEEQRDSLMVGAAMIIGNQMSDSYMKSIGELVEVMSGGGRMNLEKWLNRQAKSWAPASTMADFLHRGAGKDLRDVSPDLDLWNSFFGSWDRERLPQKYHNVYGSPVKQEGRVLAAFNTRTVDDPILLEMAAVGANVGKPDRQVSVQGAVVELDDEQYEQYQQLISQLPVKEYLGKIINSPEYQKVQDDAVKASALKKVVSKAREVAKKQLIMGNETISEKLKQQYERKVRAVAGMEFNENPDTQMYHWMEYLKDDDE